MVQLSSWSVCLTPKIPYHFLNSGLLWDACPQGFQAQEYYCLKVMGKKYVISVYPLIIMLYVTQTFPFGNSQGRALGSL